MDGVRPGGAERAAMVDRLVELQRLRACLDGEEQRLLAALAEPGDPTIDPRVDPRIVVKQYEREEIACALNVAPVTVNARLHVARELVGRLPATLGLVEAGELEFRKARLLAESLSGFPDGVAAQVEQRILPRAAAQSYTNFRRSVIRAVLAADPRSADEQHQHAAAGRKVIFRALEHGMASMWALLTVDEAAAVQTRLDAAVVTGAERTADEQRTDALVALTLGEGAGDQPRQQDTWQGRRPSVQVTVAASTLLGLDDEPAELDGHGAIPASIARRIAADTTGTWRRLLLDPCGRLVEVGRTVKDPPAPIREHVLTRDRTCRFPGCNRRARRCEIDHQHPWEDGGVTDPGNLECLCPRHHHLKHEAGWTVEGDPAGTLTWTSPTGHRYRDPPAQYPLPERPTDDEGQDAEVGRQDSEDQSPPF